MPLIRRIGPKGTFAPNQLKQMQDPKYSPPVRAQTNRGIISCLSLVTAKDFYLIAIPLPIKKYFLISKYQPPTIGWTSDHDTEQKVTFDAESRKPRKQALAKSESLSDPIMAQSDPTTVLPKAPRRKIIVVLARHERDFRMLSEDESEYGTGSRSPEPLA